MRKKKCKCKRSRGKCKLHYGGCSQCSKGKAKLAKKEQKIMELALDINKAYKKRLIGGGIATKLYQKLANAYRKVFHPQSRPLYEGELHPYGAQFLGPGTRIDLPDVRYAKPSSPVDDCARTHDFEYEAIRKSNKSPSEKAKAIQNSDKRAIKCFKERFNTDPTLARLGIAGLGTKVTVEKLLSLLKGTPSVIYGGKKKRGHSRRPSRYRSTKRVKSPLSMRSKYSKLIKK